MKLISGGAQDASIQDSLKDKSCIEKILINKRVLIKPKFDVLLTLFPLKMGRGRNPLFLARAPTRGHPYFGSLLEPSGITRSLLTPYGKVFGWVR